MCFNHSAWKCQPSMFDLYSNFGLFILSVPFVYYCIYFYPPEKEKEMESEDDTELSTEYDAYAGSVFSQKQSLLNDCDYENTTEDQPLDSKVL